MWTKLGNFWDTLRTSYWFVPTGMAVGTVVLWVVMIRIDRNVPPGYTGTAWWVYGGGMEGAREVLSTVAGSMITVAGVVFSITMVALTMAAQQFGPRLLRSFMRDRGNQVVLGTFVSTFLYCLLVLRTVREGRDGEFVPQIAVTVAVGLAILSIAVLIYFIHHASMSLQSTSVVLAVSRDADQVIERVYPKELSPQEREQDQQPTDGEAESTQAESSSVRANVSGYLQVVDESSLIGLAQERDLVVTLSHRPGDFVVRDAEVAKVWPADRLDQEVEDAVRDALVIGKHRTSARDIAFVISQFSEVAVRSLSSSINDPYTATECVDRLGAALSKLAGRSMPQRYSHDERGRLRLIHKPNTFMTIANETIGDIRPHCRHSKMVTLRLLEMI